MSPHADLGRIATSGNSFRARAERRQREFRVRIGAGCAKYGHWLDAAAVSEGKNFLTETAHRHARDRQAAGKGVADRTFANMLASQAMCFNVFAPLADDLRLATEVLRPVVDGLAAVRKITFEYTPLADVFVDQSATGGVDCDLRIDADWNDGTHAVITMETKFVEPDFSSCAFRKKSRLKPRKDGTTRPYCPDDVMNPASSCLYDVKKRYRYWEQTLRLATLAAAPDRGCPFAGGEWQLWLNHTLAHALADRDGAQHARFVVCAPSANRTLLGDGILERFQQRLARADTFRFLALDDLLASVRSAVERRTPELRAWSAGLDARYGGFERELGPAAQSA